MNPIDVVTASAGTGKTYRLVREATAALDGGLSPERLMAVTFTNRAAAELVERMRTHLLESGRSREAERLLGARIGTVNAIFGDLLREFALEAGRSPVVEVVSEGTTDRLFAAAADAAIAEHAETMEEIAARFSFNVGRKKIDWRRNVMEVASKARANGIAAADIPSSGRRSWETLRALLPPVDPVGAAALDAALLRAVEGALSALRGKEDSKKTIEAVAELDEAATTLRRRPADLPWASWSKLANLSPGKLAIPLVAPVVEAACAHARHPRLAWDLEAFTLGLFDCAAEAAAVYRRWKDQRGVVDFSDQEATALELLGKSEVVEALRERVGRVLVDEFQDTSPIQLALFLRMAAIADRSVWVGDPKQAIYGFRGTDPELMASVVGRLPDETGGRRGTLDTSRRSRPGLVGFFDDAFVPAFGTIGMPAGQVKLGTAAHGDAPGQSCPLAMMPLAASNQAQEASALAAGVVAMLRDPSAWIVAPKNGEPPRPLRPGDVAVLCRRNDRCAAVADELEQLGVRAAVGRSGLLDSAEVVVALAAFRWAVDGRDRLALAEMAHLSAPEDSAWLPAALSGEREDLERLVPATVTLRDVRSRLLHLTPSEALDAAMEAVGAAAYAASLGGVEARLANLEALRALAKEYEDECASLEAPATAGGLAAWLMGHEADRPPNPDANAVQVMTCHGSKGLEWPVVILSDLGEPPEPRVFDQVVAEQSGRTVKADDPLADRWLRYWPWPYGSVSKVDLKEAAAESPAGMAAAERARSETIRLLYVAMTRARDYLILAPRLGKQGVFSVGWLDRLVGAAGTPVLRLPVGQGTELVAGAAVHPVRVLPTATNLGREEATGTVHWAPPVNAFGGPHAPLRLRPSAELARAAIPYDVVELGPRLPLGGTPDMQALGEALHSFFAVDRVSDARADRLARASGCLSAWMVAGALLPGDLVESADRLWRWCGEQWPGSALEREIPVTGRLGHQRVSGRIDLLVRSSGGICLVDHKAFPAERAAWGDKVAAVAPQLDIYAKVCSSAGHRISARCIHLPVSGAMLVLRQ
jgi:ATP-dependent exoDNAse (exonuclease V) beta subunit